MEAVGQLAGGVSHDFNNLVCIIMGYCELLEARISSDDPNKGMVEQIHKAGTSAAALTRQLLAFSRPSCCVHWCWI
jgi:signal transduction histidine kinase